MDCLHNPKNKTNDESSIEPEHVFYTIIGKHKAIDSEGNPILTQDCDNVFAKKLNSNNSTKYFIKVGLYGKVYNPIGMYSEGRHTKFLTKAGKKEYDFKQVPQKVFDMYLRFLRSKNIAWLNNAERELT